MGKKTYTIDDVRAYSTIKINNNKQGVVNSLNKLKFGVPNTIKDSDLSTVLLNIYKEDKHKYLAILDDVKYNENADNYTTNAGFISSINDSVRNSEKFSNFDFKDALTTAGDFFGGRTETTSQTTTTTGGDSGSSTGKKQLSGLSTGAIVGISLGAVSLIGIIIFVVVKK